MNVSLKHHDLGKSPSPFITHINQHIHTWWDSIKSNIMPGKHKFWKEIILSCPCLNHIYSIACFRNKIVLGLSINKIIIYPSSSPCGWRSACSCIFGLKEERDCWLVILDSERPRRQLSVHIIMLDGWWCDDLS